MPGVIVREREMCRVVTRQRVARESSKEQRERLAASPRPLGTKWNPGDMSCPPASQRLQECAEGPFDSTLALLAATEQLKKPCQLGTCPGLARVAAAGICDPQGAVVPSTDAAMEPTLHSPWELFELGTTLEVRCG